MGFVVGAIVATAIMYPACSDEPVTLDYLRFTGWVPEELPPSGSVVHHSKDIDINTSVTQLRFGIDDFVDLTKLLKEGGIKIHSTYDSNWLEGERGEFYWFDGYLIVVDDQSKLVTVFSSWEDAGISRWKRPAGER